MTDPWRALDEDEEDERLKGPRMLTLACGCFVLGMIALMAMLLAVCVVAEAGDGMACSRPPLPMPRTVVIRPGVDAAPWRAAIAQWDAFDPARVRFVEVGQDYEADVYIVPTDGRTWVELPCGRVESVVYVGHDADMWYWAAHELGHTLGFADWIRPGDDTTGYLNPERCDPAGSGYQGIMAYCAPRSAWFGAWDRWLLWRWM